jgi:hypothetical protein
LGSFANVDTEYSNERIDQCLWIRSLEFQFDGSAIAKGTAITQDTDLSLSINFDGQFDFIQLQIALLVCLIKDIADDLQESLHLGFEGNGIQGNALTDDRFYLFCNSWWAKPPPVSLPLRSPRTTSVVSVVSTSAISHNCAVSSVISDSLKFPLYFR